MAASYGSSLEFDANVVATEKVETVDLVTATQVLQISQKPPDLIKIDVEGHEYPVLRSIAELGNVPRAVIFEHHTPDRQVATSISDFVNAMGLKIFRIDKRLWGYCLTKAELQPPKGFVASHHFVAIAPK